MHFNHPLRISRSLDSRHHTLSVWANKCNSLWSERVLHVLYILNAGRCHQVAFEACKPLSLVDVQVAPPQKGEERVTRVRRMDVNQPLNFFVRFTGNHLLTLPYVRELLINEKSHTGKRNAISEERIFRESRDFFPCGSLSHE